MRRFDEGFFTFLIVFACFLMVPHAAYAYASNDPTVDHTGGGGHAFGDNIVWGPNVVGPDDLGVMVNTYDKYVAAFSVVTQNLSGVGIGEMDSDMKAQLSNPQTGGAFYTFAQKFTNNNIYLPWYNSDYFFGSVGHVAQSFYSGLVSLYYSPEEIFVATYTAGELRDAQRDLLVILDGVSIGSGDTSSDKFIVSPIGSYYHHSRTEAYLEPPYVGIGSCSVEFSYVTNPSSLGLKYFALVIPSDNYRKFGETSISSIGGISVRLFASATPITVDFTKTEMVLPVTYDCLVSSSSNIYYWEKFNLSGWGTRDSTNHTIDFSRDTVLGFTGVKLKDSGKNEYFIPGGTVVGKVLRTYYLSSTLSGTVIPPSNWPDAPDTPTPEPPEVPEPPAVTPPEIPDIDFTPDIQGILDAMAEHCRHIRTQIQQSFESLESYLYGLFNWLADRFSYAVEPFDDKNLLYWLKRIYSRLGRGGNSKPADPVTDPLGFGDWLDTLFTNFLTALFDLFPGVAQAVGTLATKFPFSLPFDIGLLITSLVAEPVVPQFDLPLYTVDSGGVGVEGAIVSVDMTPFDSAWGAVRIFETMSFTAVLMGRTKDFMEVLEKAVGL